MAGKERTGIGTHRCEEKKKNNMEVNRVKTPQLFSITLSNKERKILTLFYRRGLREKSERRQLREGKRGA